MVASPDNLPHTVQLLHELPDGSSHIDWMIDLDPLGGGRLVTFHLERRVDELAPGQQMQADRIADHRRDYLEHEGPVSGGRGAVKRVAAGHIEAFQTLGDVWALLIRWTGPERHVRWQRVRVMRRDDGYWHVKDLGSPSA